MYRAVLFDLDDTLFDRGAAFRRWAAAFAAARPGANVDVEVMARLDDRGRRPRRELADEVVRRFGLDEDAAALAAGLPAALLAHVAPEAGVVEAVAALAARARVAVVTNGRSATQRGKLARLGLADVVGAVFVSEEIGADKPAPAIFEAAIAWAGCDAAACLMVGDDPVRDVAPARALGMDAAWRPREPWPTELAAPTYTIASIDEAARIALGAGGRA